MNFSSNMKASNSFFIFIFHVSIILLGASQFNDKVKDKKKLHASNPRQKLIQQYTTSNNKPEQIHLSFGSNANDIVILWSSSSYEKSFIEYGNNPQKISHVLAQSIELKEHSKNAKKYVYRAELKNLQPGKRYIYRIISGTSGIKSSLFSIDVPHNDRDRSHTFMVLADMGLLTKSLESVIHEALDNQYDAVFHVGDIAYNLDTKDGNYADRFMNRLQKFTAKVPYVTTPGDHEKLYNFYQYRHRFSTPDNHWPMKEEELWYSIDIGYTHFISINTQILKSDAKFRQMQLDWLRSDLIKANQNRQQYPWIILMGHKPLYCTKTIRPQGCEKAKSERRDTLEILLYQYGVDLYISGHKHSYERSWPVYDSRVLQTNTINPKAPIHIISGTLGYQYLFHAQRSTPNWLAASFTRKGKELYCRLEIINATHLLWSAHVASTNKKVDEMTIIQNHHGSFGTPGPRSFGMVKKSDKHDLKLKESITYSSVSFNSSSNIHIMFLVGIFSFSFLVFLFLRYSRTVTGYRF